MDKIDRIWLGFGYGEWGGDLHVFNTGSKEFEKPRLNKFDIALWPVKSFFEDKSTVYLSSGLDHMMASGIIVKFDDSLSASVVFESGYGNEVRQTSKDSTLRSMNGEYIGPAVYNSFNNSIYYYSQNGIFKGELSKDLSKIKNWDLVIKPKLHWNNGQPDAVGSPMNVLKLEIIDGDRFVLLSQNDGIGFYDGARLTMTK